MILSNPAAHTLGSGSTLAVISATGTVCGIVSNEPWLRIVCYRRGQTVAVEPNISFSAIAGGRTYLCGIRSGGDSLICQNKEVLRVGTVFASGLSVAPETVLQRRLPSRHGVEDLVHLAGFLGRRTSPLPAASTPLPPRSITSSSASTASSGPTLSAFLPRTKIIADVDYAVTGGSDLRIVIAGVRQSVGKSRPQINPPRRRHFSLIHLRGRSTTSRSDEKGPSLVFLSKTASGRGRSRTQRQFEPLRIPSRADPAYIPLTADITQLLPPPLELHFKLDAVPSIAEAPQFSHLSNSAPSVLFFCPSASAAGGPFLRFGGQCSGCSVTVQISYVYTRIYIEQPRAECSEKTVLKATCVQQGRLCEDCGSREERRTVLTEPAWHGSSLSFSASWTTRPNVNKGIECIGSAQRWQFQFRPAAAPALYAATCTKKKFYSCWFVFSKPSGS